MLTQKDAKVGNRVQWRNGSSGPDFGTITAITDDGEVLIKYDDGEEGSTYIDSTASNVYPA